MSAAVFIEQIRPVLSADPAAGDIADFIGVQRVGPVAVLTLARPERHNVVDLAGWRRIADTATALAADPALRVVLVRGSGTAAFGAGADIAEFPSTRMPAAVAAGYNDAVAHALAAVRAIPVPVIALIDGLAVGGALELSAVCDLRIATERSRFGLPIGRLGVALGLTETEALARLVGPAELMYLILSGRLVDAAHALRTGLVQRVVPDGDLVDEALDLVGAITTASLPTLLAAKSVLDMTTRPLSARDTERLARIAVEIYDGPDLAEGVAAFRERRPPRFPSQQPCT